MHYLVAGKAEERSAQRSTLENGAVRNDVEGGSQWGQLERQPIFVHQRSTSQDMHVQKTIRRTRFDCVVCVSGREEDRRQLDTYVAGWPYTSR